MAKVERDRPRVVGFESSGKHQAARIEFHIPPRFFDAGPHKVLEACLEAVSEELSRDGWPSSPTVHQRLEMLEEWRRGMEVRGVG